jgi:V8-like Glu-specific endopeptidase
VLCGAALSAGCAAPAAEPAPTETSAALIYGVDQRVDLYAATSAQMRALATESAVALVDPNHLVRSADGGAAVSAPTLGETYNLCTSERFREQPAAARCSGVVVDDRLVLTAGHCVREDASCGDDLWVFNYALSVPDGPPTLSRDDIYRCAAIPVRVRGTDGEGRRWDYAFVELDRPVVPPRRAAPLAEAPVAAGPGQVSVIGFPGGLPVKIDASVDVLDARADALDYFTMDSDTFDRSSGSGVFDASNHLAGVFVRGDTDYEYQADPGCFVSRHIGEAIDPGGSEQAGYVTPAISCLCATGWSNASLCARDGPPCPSGPGIEALPGRGGCAIASPAPASAASERLLAAALALAMVALAGRRRSLRGCRLPR